MSRFTVGNPA